MSQKVDQQAKLRNSKTLTRHYDTFGRNVGYSVDGDRKQSIVYDIATGRIAESDGFRWTYLPGTNLKSQLIYPNEAVVTWSYEPHRDLLTAVTNATYSTYVYTNDLLGRRTSKNDEQYGYNVRDELISADNVSYNYDDIGNRITAEGKTYTANNLNQYTAIDDFTPQYDADGNQTLIKTSTGIWSVQYNAENRPIRWTQGSTIITMAFDRMGRRIEMRTQSADADLLQRFVYDNYLCIQQLRGTDNTLFHSYVWDPTEPIASRPLVFLPATSSPSYYFHDGNKNVSDLVPPSGAPIHYAYTPFGSPTASATSGNPFGFSSEFYDEQLGLVYYNYRHYDSQEGRWYQRDLIDERKWDKNPFSFCKNNGESRFDYCGLSSDELIVVGHAFLYHTRMFGIDKLGGASFRVKVKCSESGDWSIISKGRNSSSGSEMAVEQFDFGFRVHYDGSGKTYSDLVPIAVLGSAAGALSAWASLVASGVMAWLGQQEWTITYAKSISVTCQCEMVDGERKYKPVISTTESLIRYTPTTRDFNLNSN